MRQNKKSIKELFILSDNPDQDLVNKGEYDGDTTTDIINVATLDTNNNMKTPKAINNRLS